MAILTTNRKRSDKCFSFGQKSTIPFRHSSNLQALKKPRSSDKLIPSCGVAISRLSRYPIAKISVRRVFHARPRGFLRFRLFVRASVFKSKAKRRECLSNEELLFGQKDAAKRATLRLHSFGDSIYDESSFEEVKVVEDDRENLVEEYSSMCGVSNSNNGKNLMENPVEDLENFTCSNKSVSSSSATISRLTRYSSRQVSLKQKFHARCRGFLRFGLFVRASVLKRKGKPREFCGNEEISKETGDLFGHEDAAKKATLRLHPSEDSSYEESNIEDVHVVEDDKENLVEEHSSSWDVQNFIKGNDLRISLLQQSCPMIEKPFEASHEPFLPLKEEEEAEVKRAFSESNRMKVFVSHKKSNIDIRGETLQCLRPTAWLNDEVINLYLELLKERETRDPQKYFKCHFFNTFFYVKVVSGSGYNYEAVRRWTTHRKLGYDLIDCDIIFVPIHAGIHWTLAVINNRECKFMYLDSLNGVNHMVLNALAKYLVDEVKDKNGKDIDVSSWGFEYVKDLPRQLNGYDCGMFMLKYIDFFCRGLKLHFSQKDMPYFRLRTAKEILRLHAH